MEYLIIILVCFFSSVVGAICGIGGGVIIKPVLDATGVMAVTTVSFLSGCTVLSMSVVSLYKNLKAKHTFVFDKAFATVLALGGVVGGLTGKELYQGIISRLEDSSRVGAVQAFVLMIVTVGTLAYTVRKEKIHTKNVQSRAVIFGIGIILGILSSFLGIGGGPINLVVLFFFFSMETKQAALYSIYVIMFSQISSLLSTVFKNNVPPFEPQILILMIACGVLGGLAGSKINKKIENRTVDKLFMGLMAVIICINIYNIFRYI
ncbi:sulfite exporter TauE/SafE family protein [bacterium C-53]|nr:sulfite exporter TauE/SafE family protein [Lachnospiraceae bacterium]NBI02900.1 sulfite exporter TauE/SafE family protein [Lachnospiraceae bacterium]RKJ11024.1 sulfite exporter TauE/SafE family protein [bacterium C-53]